jgi:hypothetical protein
MNISHKLLTGISENLSSGAIAVAIKSLCLYDDRDQLVTIEELENNVSLSVQSLFNYLEEIDKKLKTGKPDEDRINILPIDLTNLKSTKQRVKEEGKKKADQRKPKSPQKKDAEEIYDNILNPWFDEVRKKGYGEIITSNFSKFCHGIMKKVRKEYNFTDKEILDILKLGLEDEYLKENNLNTNPRIIFFSGATIVQKYISGKSNICKIKDHKGDTVDPKEYGYFKKKNGKFIFIPPKNDDSIYHKLQEEIEKRIQGEQGNEEYDHLFEKGSLKDKYRWVLGKTGKDNQFVEDK